jgi:hypothetical protein
LAFRLETRLSCFVSLCGFVSTHGNISRGLDHGGLYLQSYLIYLSVTEWAKHFQLAPNSNGYRGKPLQKYFVKLLSVANHRARFRAAATATAVPHLPADICKELAGVLIVAAAPLVQTKDDTVVLDVAPSSRE